MHPTGAPRSGATRTAASPSGEACADAPATLGDLRALIGYAFDAERFRALRMPVLLQTGSESPREIYVTDALAPVLPGVCIEALPGQAHEAMTTAPALYGEAVSRFLPRA